MPSPTPPPSPCNIRDLKIQDGREDAGVIDTL